MDEALVARQDRGGLAAPVQAKIYEGIAARTHRPGDALSYPTGEEYRDDGELARMAEQLAGKPLTLLHPVGGLLRDGAVAKTIGTVIGARVDGGRLIARVLVSDSEGEAAIGDGMHELSMGYGCKLDSARYQRGTIVDHLAVVPKARCGPMCSLRTDCAGCATAQDAATVGQGDATCKCHATSQSEVVENVDSKLTAADREAIPAGRFAVPGRKALPLEDANHVKDAMSRFDQEHFAGPAEKKAAFHHIVARAHELGMDPSGFVKKHGGRLDTEEMNMDDLQKQLDAATADAAAQKTRADEAEKTRNAEKARADAAELAAREAQKDANAEKTRADAADVARKTAEDKATVHTDAAFDARVAQRVEVLGAAAQVLPAADKDGKAIDRTKTSDLDLMKEIARHVDGDDAVLDTDSEDAVRVSFRGAMKRFAKARGSHAVARATIHHMRQDAAVDATAKAKDTEAAAYREMSSSMQRPRSKKS